MPDVSAQTAAACDLIARLVKPTAGAEITRSRGTFDAPFGEQVFAGCRVVITGSFTALADDQPSPDEVLRQALPAEAWTHEFDFDADGPDSTDAVYRRGSTVCVVAGRWHGALPPAYAEAWGDVEDNDLPPWDPYYVNVGCTDRAGPLRAAPADDSVATESDRHAP